MKIIICYISRREMGNLLLAFMLFIYLAQIMCQILYNISCNTVLMNDIIRIGILDK